MQLITKLSILLLINFVAYSTEGNISGSLCDAEHTKKVECYRLAPYERDIRRDIETIAEKFTRAEDEINSLRATINGYCQSGTNFFQCWENLEFLPQCAPDDPVTTENLKFDDKVTKFGMEYACQDDGEAILKIAANNGLRSLINNQTDAAAEQCLKSVPSSRNLTRNETWCRNVGILADCFLIYSDTLDNKEISGIIRDVLPKFKVNFNCNDNVAA